MSIKTEKDILSLITNKVKESLTLEYKRCSALSMTDRAKSDISKDVSAFANSVEGTIIYGIKEEGHLPIEIDDGFDPREITKERIESVIASTIKPKIDGVKIIPVELKKTRPGKWLYVVNIPQSTRAPHQASDYRYYKRYNFQSNPMEDYEIKDIANRRASLRPIILIDTFIRNSMVIYLSIKNIGNEIATDVKLKPDKDLYLRGEREAEEIPIFLKGIKFFPPNKEFVFWYGTFPEIMNGNKKPSKFNIKVTYKKVNDPITKYIDEFLIDINDYYFTTSTDSSLERSIKEIIQAINSLTDKMTSKMERLARLEDIASSTGLQLSVDTLRNIRHITSVQNRF